MKFCLCDWMPHLCLHLESNMTVTVLGHGVLLQGWSGPRVSRTLGGGKPRFSHRSIGQGFLVRDFLGPSILSLGDIGSFYSIINTEYMLIFEGSLGVKLPTIWTNEKQRWEESEKRREEERRSKKRKSQKKEDPGARKGRKVAKHCVFQWFEAPEGRKVGSLKRRVRSQLARWEMKNCTPLRREAHFQVKMYKTHQARTTFGSWDVRGSDHFWTFRCRFAWQAHGIVHLVKSEQNMMFFLHFQKRWQAWDIWRGSAKMHFPWQAQYKRHVHQSCVEVRALISWDGLHFGASDFHVCWDDFA